MIESGGNIKKIHRAARIRRASAEAQRVAEYYRVMRDAVYGPPPVPEPPRGTSYLTAWRRFLGL